MFSYTHFYLSFLKNFSSFYHTYLYTIMYEANNAMIQYKYTNPQKESALSYTLDYTSLATLYIFYIIEFNFKTCTKK